MCFVSSFFLVYSLVCSDYLLWFHLIFTVGLLVVPLGVCACVFYRLLCDLQYTSSTYHTLPWNKVIPLCESCKDHTTIPRHLSLPVLFATAVACFNSTFYEFLIWFHLGQRTHFERYKSLLTCVFMAKRMIFIGKYPKGPSKECAFLF